MDHGKERFGPFELDVEVLDLRCNGRPVEMAPLPLKVLSYLVGRAGEIVSRDELRGEFWGPGTLGFDDRLNTCIASIRAALGDNASAPRFVSTVRGRGYRFIGHFSAPEVSGPGVGHEVPTSATDSAQPARSPIRDRRHLPTRSFALVAAAGVLLLGWGSVVVARAGAGHPEDELVGVDSRAAELFVRGTNYLARSQIPSELEEAVRLFREAVDLEPDFALAQARLGLAASRLGWMYGIEEMGAVAEAAATRALSLEPRMPEALVALGHVRYTAREYEEALELYQTADRVRPDDPEVLSSIAFLQRRTGDWNAAADNLTRAFELDPTSVAFASALASTWESLRRWDEADHYYRLALSIEPQVEENYVFRALLVLKAGGTPDSALARLLEGAHLPADSARRFGLIPRSQELTRLLGPLYASQVLANVPQAWDGAHSIQNSVAWLRAESGDREGSRRLWRSILRELDPAVVGSPFEGRSWPAVHLDRARALTGLGRMEEALEQIDLLLGGLARERDERAWGVLGPQIAAALLEVGDRARAARLVGQLLDRPSLLSRPLLAIDPVWAHVGEP